MTTTERAWFWIDPDGAAVCKDCGPAPDTASDDWASNWLDNVDGPVVCTRCDDTIRPDDTCRDCGRPIVWSDTDHDYHHTVDPERGCFLIRAEHPAEEQTR